MNTRLSKKETMVYGNIEVMADVIGGNKYFTFAELYDFDLDNTKDELKEILNRERLLEEFSRFLRNLSSFKVRTIKGI